MRIRRHRIYVRFGFMFMFDCNLNTLQRIMFVALTCFVNVCKKKISCMFNVWDVRGFMSVFLICCYCFCSLFGYFFNVVLMLLSCFFSLLTAPALGTTSRWLRKRFLSTQNYYTFCGSIARSTISLSPIESGLFCTFNRADTPQAIIKTYRAPNTKWLIGERSK